MLYLHRQEVDGKEVPGYMFTWDEDPTVAAFFYDLYKNDLGRRQAPGPHMMCEFMKLTYHCVQLLPTAHPHLIPDNVKAVLKSSYGKFLQDCAVTVQMLEYPNYNMCDRESQCQYDQKLLVDISQQQEKQLSSPRT